MNHQLSADDRRFKKCVEACSIPVSEFDHRAHIRLAYVYLTDSHVDKANQQVRQSLTLLLQHNNINPADKYHETLTRAWLLAVHHLMKNTKDTHSADAFMNEHPSLLDSRIMMTHYSSERLFSDDARRSFLEPDLEIIPLGR